MNKRETVYQLLNGDAGLRDLGLEKVYRSNAPDAPEFACFMNLVWGTASPQLPEDVHTQDLTLWVYDTPGYYGRVDDILDRCRGLMHDLVGGVVRQTTWFGDSGDLYDDKYDRLLRTGTYTVH